MNRGFKVVEDKFRKLKNEVTLPKRGSKHSAGYDFFLMEDLEIRPGETRISWSDVKSYMLPDEVLMIYIRSSLGIKKSLSIANGTGIIDCDYFGNSANDGNIAIALYNRGKETIVLSKGDRVAQGIFTKYLVSDTGNDESERVGGIGSTSK